MSKKKSKGKQEDLFMKSSGQLSAFHKSVEQRNLEKGGKVQCLGLEFDSEDARREHFLGLLAEKLKDPEFRKTPGFPKGEDEDILRLSDPPWYTACPNPFQGEFVEHYGRPYDPEEPYHREPFAVDVSVGKTDALYRAHSYHTKVPHLAIVPSILHYTKPGDIVLDGFCGSGMTGVAAQFCGTAPGSYRKKLEAEWKAEGLGKPEWGARRAILNDLSPAATFIAANYNIPFDVDAFAREAERILKEVDDELGWMYETLHTDGKTKGRINYTVWSEVFSCPECGGEVNFVAEALDPKTKRVLDSFPCPGCGVELTKRKLHRFMELLSDPATGQPWSRIRFRPSLINYRAMGTVFDKSPDQMDLAIIAKIAGLPLPAEVPTEAFPIDDMYHGSRLAPKGITHVHHILLPRAAQALASLWRKAQSLKKSRLRSQLLWFVEQAVVTMTLQNRFQPQGFKQVNKYLPGVYYIPSHTCEVAFDYAIAARGKRIISIFGGQRWRTGDVIARTGSCTNLGLPDSHLDYVFTDPPFGENIFYADLNFLVESWHGVITDAEPEAIVDKFKDKGPFDYQELMRRCFQEYHRVLKPGRWMTVVFSNSSNNIWRAIQEAIGAAGFVVADVRSLDKKQGSYRQVTSSATKQDLVVSAYKPTEELATRFQLGHASAADAWSFVNEHLRNLPIFIGRNNRAEVIAERTAQRLQDRMIAFHVQRGLAVPLGTAEFNEGLKTRLAERDEMYFLPDQVDIYDRKRAHVEELGQLELFVNDEASAIQWVKRELRDKPRSFQDLQPDFMRHTQSWAKHEETIDLRVILDQNCLLYEGTGPVPSQIHSYLSTNFKDLRNLEKEDPLLRAKAANRWYVPDPSKEADLRKLREKALLREFEGYKDPKQRKLKQFRTEAIRVGFQAAFQARDYDAIVKVAAKIPEKVLQGDEKLLMFYDAATMFLGE